MASTRSNWAGNQRWVVAEHATPRATEEVAAWSATPQPRAAA
jgi:hypothetical protein